MDGGLTGRTEQKWLNEWVNDVKTNKKMIGKMNALKIAQIEMNNKPGLRIKINDLGKEQARRIGEGM